MGVYVDVGTVLPSQDSAQGCHKALTGMWPSVCWCRIEWMTLGSRSLPASTNRHTKKPVLLLAIMILQRYRELSQWVLTCFSNDTSCLYK